MSKYGIFTVENVVHGTSRVALIVEKTARVDAPSDLAVVGRYVLKPNIFERLRDGVRGVSCEILHTDAIVSDLAVDIIYAC